MTYSIERPVFSGGAGTYLFAVGMAVLMLGGCAGNSVDNAAPVAPAGPGVVGPDDTGTYPNLNIPKQQAAPQFTEAEKKAKLASLRAEGNANAKGGGARPNPKDSAELGKLARNHGKDTLKAIGTTCDPTLDPTCK